MVSDEETNMKGENVKPFACGMTIVLLFVALSSHASEEGSFGVGVGALYSGIGVNAALRSENDFRYLSAGCVALGYSDADGSITACGVGAGWLWSDILSDANNRHGLGIYLGPVGWRGRTYAGNDWDTIYGAGVTYGYFFNGIDKDGWNLGGTLAVGHKDDARGYLLLQAGHQF